MFVNFAIVGGNDTISPMRTDTAMPLLLSLALFAADARADSIDPPPPTTTEACSSYGRPARSGKVPEALAEFSGLAPSRRHDGIYWAHNDSGNAFELFAIDATGHIHARLALRGGSNRDIEDIAIGPCAADSDESCIYVGDIGDNLYRYDDGRIYRLREPETLQDGNAEVDLLRFEWPHKPRNAEAMVADPRTGTLFVWTKEPRSLGVVHRLEGLAPGKTGRAVAVKQIHAPDPGAGLPTAADTHPEGERILIRTYSQVWELRQPSAERIEDILEAEPIPLPSRLQQQSEAISYHHDGRGYLFGTEGSGGPIYTVGCEEPRTGSSRSSS